MCAFIPESECVCARAYACARAYVHGSRPIAISRLMRISESRFQALAVYLVERFSLNIRAAGHLQNAHKSEPLHVTASKRCAAPWGDEDQPPVAVTEVWRDLHPVLEHLHPSACIIRPAPHTGEHTRCVVRGCVCVRAHCTCAARPCDAVRRNPIVAHVRGCNLVGICACTHMSHKTKAHVRP